jgi:hypothetical protein
MRKITDFQTINKKAKLSNWFSAIGIILLIGSLFIGYDGIRMYLSLATTILAFIVVMVGTNLAKKFTGRPRPDELINKALKGLSNDYTLYNHITPVDHLLVGPKGLWIFNTKRSRGTFFYDQKRKTYKHVGGGILVQYLKIFNLEGIGNPVKDYQKDTKKIKSLLADKLGKTTDYPIHHVTIVVDELSTVECENAPVPTIHVKALRDYMTNDIQNEEATLSEQQIEQIKALFADQAEKAKAYAKEHDEK